MKSNKFIKIEDFMGYPIYWLNGLSMAMSTNKDIVCCIYENSNFSRMNNIMYGEKRYTYEIILPPYHEDRIIGSAMLLKDAKNACLKEIDKLKVSY